MSLPMTRDPAGSRLASPKIHRDSRLIHKRPQPSSSSSSSTAATSRRHPVIIYTHSPKVFHTDVKDFMTLVQKLTGRSASADIATDAPTTTTTNNCSSSSSSSSSPPAQPPPPPPPPPPPTANISSKDNTEIKPADDSSSTSENGGFQSPVLAEMPPFFSHGSSPDLFCYPGGTYFGPGVDLIHGNSPPVETMNDGALSPSVIEAMTAYPSSEF